MLTPPPKRPPAARLVDRSLVEARAPATRARATGCSRRCAGTPAERLAEAGEDTAAPRPPPGPLPDAGRGRRAGAVGGGERAGVDRPRGGARQPAGRVAPRADPRRPGRGHRAWRSRSPRSPTGRTCARSAPWPPSSSTTRRWPGTRSRRACGAHASHDAYLRGDAVEAERLARLGLARAGDDEGRRVCLAALGEASLSRGAWARGGHPRRRRAGPRRAPRPEPGVGALAALYGGDPRRARELVALLPAGDVPSLLGLAAYVTAEIDSVEGRTDAAEEGYTRRDGPRPERGVDLPRGHRRGRAGVVALAVAGGSGPRSSGTAR